jgi:hypothetical protein
MLNKLMKYELKATSRLLVPLYLIMIILSLVNSLFLNINDYEGIVGVINVFLKISYVLSIFVVLIVTVLYMIIRFYKNLLTDEGYLMFTLPTKTHHLITSKLLSTLLWIIVSIIAILISLFVMFASQINLSDIINGLNEFTAALNRELGGNSAVLLIELAFMVILGIVANILLIYVSIAIGQLFSKHKIIGSFAAYMLIYMAIQFLMMIVFIPFGVLTLKSPEPSDIPRVIFPTIIAVLTLGCTGFYIGTNYILKRKLNLD